MKHLVKKYVRHLKVGQDVTNLLENIPVDEKQIAEIKQKKLDGYYGMVYTEDNELFQTFKYEKDGTTYLLPEPDPIVIYFDTARNNYRQIKDLREEIFKTLKMFDQNLGATMGNFYWYFSIVSSYTIFLFLSIEAFINKSIPKDYEYRRPVQDKKIEVYNKFQVQRNIDFIEKLKVILPEITGKNFVAEHTHKFEQIKKLKLFRDEVVHTKSFEGDNVPNFYENLYVMSLDFEFEKTLLYVRDFINYYQPNLIEECQCGRD